MDQDLDFQDFKMVSNAMIRAQVAATLAIAFLSLFTCAFNKCWLSVFHFWKFLHICDKTHQVMHPRAYNRIVELSLGLIWLEHDMVAISAYLISYFIISLYCKLAVSEFQIHTGLTIEKQSTETGYKKLWPCLHYSWKYPTLSCYHSVWICVWCGSVDLN